MIIALNGFLLYETLIAVGGLAAAVSAPELAVRYVPRAMALADTFQEIVDALPDDWTDLTLDLRIFDEDRYIDAAVYLVHVQRRSRTRSTTGTGRSSSRTASGTPRRRRPSTAR